MTNDLKLDTNVVNTWCAGCGNFGILTALKQVIISLAKKGIPKENIVVVSGIGCHAKIVDYLNINTFYGLHGRAIPTAEGIKLANPKLKVIVCAGDGDAYNEGISHLIHAAKRNIDITVLVHDNRTFALTTGQFTSTSPWEFKGPSTPEGSIEKPFNPLELMMASGATFISRGYTAHLEHLKNLIFKAIIHKGFSFVDILQPCVSFFNTFEVYNKRAREIKLSPAKKTEALKIIRQWDYDDYNKDGPKIPLGIFYQVKRPTYEKKLLGNFNPSKRKTKREYI